MNLLLINLIFMLAWASMTGSFSEINLFAGFVIGLFAIWLIREQVGGRHYFGRTTKVVALALLFLKELALSAYKVAIIALKPNLDLKPGIFAYKLKADKDFEIALLANMITLTPGTLSVDVTEDRKYLFVHALDCSDLKATRADIASGFERKIMEAFR